MKLAPLAASLSAVLVTTACDIANQREIVEKDRTITSIRFQAERFMHALLDGDMRVLISYEQSSGGFFPNGQLSDEDRYFVTVSTPEKKSFQDILGPSWKVDLANQADGSWIAIYYPDGVSNAMSDEFLRFHWMKGYVACWFFEKGGEIKLKNNMCFSETDGPYPSEPVEMEHLDDCCSGAV